MICPNFNDPVVKQEFEELVSAVGEVAAYDIWNQNNGYSIDKAPNGEPSKLFSDLLSHFNGERVPTIQAKAKVYGNSFKTWFGDWLQDDKTNVSKVVDENGEPLMVYHGTPNGEFDTFSFKYFGQTDPGDRGTGFYFAHSLSDAGVYGSTYITAYLNIREPYTGNKESSLYAGATSKELIQNIQNTIDYFVKSSLKSVLEQQNDSHSAIFDYADIKDDDSKEIVEGKLKTYYTNQSKNNNIIGNFDTTDGYISDYELVVYNPNQIKSVDNVGTFSQEANNIYSYLGEKTFPTAIAVPVGQETIFQTISSTEALNEIIASGSEYSDLAKKLIKYTEKSLVNVNYTTDHLEKSRSGYYRTIKDNGKLTGHTIVISTSSNKWLNGIKEHLILHEIVHSLSAIALLQDEVKYNQVQGYINDLSKYKNLDFVTKALTSPEEFISEFYTNFEFVNFLKETVYKRTNQSWFQKIISTIKNWFGIKESFDKLQALMDSILDLQSGLNINEEIGNISSNLSVENTLLALEDLRNNNTQTEIITQKGKLVNEQIKDGLRNRIKSMRNRGVDIYTIKDARMLVDALDRLEDKDSIYDFIDRLEEDLEKPVTFISEARKNNIKVSPRQLEQFKKDYLGFYSWIIPEVSQLMSDGYFDELKRPEIETLQRRVDLAKQLIDGMREHYNYLVRNIFIEKLSQIGIEAGSPTMANYILNNTAETDSDISWFETFMGSLNNANDEALRAVYKLVQDTKNKIERNSLAKGKEIAKVAGGHHDHKALFEYDSNGKKTGFMVRDRNYGQFRRDYDDFLEKLMVKYDLQDKYTTPKENSAFIAYNKEKNKWLSEHAERMYVPEYYDIFAELSIDAHMAKEEMQQEINRVLSSVTVKRGEKPRLERLSNDQWAKLQKLYMYKRELSNNYDIYGKEKQGINLEIANELKAANAKLEGNIKYKANFGEWWKARNDFEKQHNNDPAAMAFWDSRNSRIEYSKSFWDKMSRLNKTYYGDAYEELAQERSEIFKLFRNTNGMDLDVNVMPQETQDLIKAIDEVMAEMRGEGKEGSEKGDYRFDEVAYMAINPQYNEALAKAQEEEKKNPGKFQDWYNNNHYYNGREFVPHSYWMTLTPVNSDDIITMPSQAWSEIDPDSKFFNKNFDMSAKQYLQPTKRLYDNTKAYKDIMSDPKKKALYDKILETMIEANNMLGNRYNFDPYKLPQITGNMWQHLRGSENKRNGLANYVKDNLIVNNDDNEYNTSIARSPDGSKLYSVPMYYVQDLKNPGTMTNDIAGATAAYYRMAQNFKHMNEIAPSIEIIKEQFGSRKYVKNRIGSRRADTVIGIKTNTYNALDTFTRMHVYGERKQNIEIGNVSVTKALGMIRNWTQAVNLSFNLTAIEVGAITGMHHALMEALVGRYYTKSDFAKGFATTLKSMLNIIMNWGNMRSNNKMLALLERNQVSRSNDEIFNKMNQYAASRFILNHFWYGGYSGGDFVVKSTILNTIYFNHRLVTNPKTGNKEFVSKNTFVNEWHGGWDNPEAKRRAEQLWKTNHISLYEAFDSKDGVAFIKPEFKEYVTQELENNVANLAKNLAAKADGVLNDLDRAYVHSNAFTQLVFMHRNFMLVNIQHIFTKQKMFNYQTGVVDESMFYSMKRVIPEWLKTNIKAVLTLQFHKVKGVPLDQAESANIRKLGLEMSLLSLYFVLAQLLSAEADEDDSDWMTQHLAYMFRRYYFEVKAQYDVTDLISIVKSPSAAMGTLNQVGYLLDLTTSMFAWNEGLGKPVNRGVYKRKSLVTGEDLTVFERTLWKTTPFKHLIEVQDPNTKRKYLENMILR